MFIHVSFHFHRASRHCGSIALLLIQKVCRQDFSSLCPSVTLDLFCYLLPSTDPRIHLPYSRPFYPLVFSFPGFFFSYFTSKSLSFSLYLFLLPFFRRYFHLISAFLFSCSFSKSYADTLLYSLLLFMPGPSCKSLTASKYPAQPPHGYYQAEKYPFFSL